MNFDDCLNTSKLRKTILEMAYAGSTVHIGCAFSIVELLAVLYREFVHYPENNLASELRDYLVLSKGHGVMAQYACLNALGWLSDEALQAYFKDGTKLKGLSDSRVEGLEVTSGSLGHGFSIGVGLALAAKLKSTQQKTYVIVGDGEMNEGAIWEGMLFAAHHQLRNLCLIVDMNGFQAMGRTEDVLDCSVMTTKLESFGFETLEVDGHDETQISSALRLLSESEQTKPKALVAHTVKGKGVSFMEHENIWHYTRLNEDTFQSALAELGK